MKKVLGLDLGTNSIGWALVESNFENNEGNILGSGSRIIPMNKKMLDDFDSGQSISQTADRTSSRSMRRLYQRSKLRRERLHRVLNVIQFLPEHYASKIDFTTKLGQFINGEEVKINYRPFKSEGRICHNFLFEESFQEMISDFKKRGQNKNVPKDWTIFYLRQKALSQKITKEELAWIILNFNTKRGYYQLRGENLDETKNKEFIELNVKNLIPTGEQKKGKNTYKVLFSNGWEYDKPITEKNEWEGRKKEFIVTTKILNDNTIKRSFKAVDSETDWPAIKAKTENDIVSLNKTIGQYIYENLLLDPTIKIKGGLVKTIERKFYKTELIKILNEQKKYHDELIDQSLFFKSIEELYPKNKQHANQLKQRNIIDLLVEDVIFYQRPLKSKKSSVGRCNFEFRKYIIKDDRSGENKSVKEFLKAIPKSHPLFQEFRLWQFVKNLRLFDKTTFIKGSEVDVTPNYLQNELAYVKLFDFLNEKKEIGEKTIIEYFVKNNLIEKSEKNKYRWNYVDGKKYPCNETRAELLTLLKKAKVKNGDIFLTVELELHLWHLIYSVTDKIEFKTALTNFAVKNNLVVTNFVNAFLKLSPYPSDFSSLSYKAINKLLPLMRMGKYWNEDVIDLNTKNRIAKIINGEYDEKIQDRIRTKAIGLNSILDFKGLPLWLSSYIVYGRHSEAGNIQKWSKPDQINQFLSNFKQHSLRNPTVEKVIIETLRVVRDIWIKFGNGDESFFDEIHIELSREMKNPAAKRKEISDRIKNNQKTNQRIKEVLQELMKDTEIEGDIRSYSLSHQELLKLYEEGIYQNPNANYDLVSENEIQKIRQSITPSKSDITKYKLWLKQGYLSPYTGKVISLSKLFTTEYEIEHIIPKSRYFDNSLSNKIICETDINKDKGNKTAFEYLKQNGNSQVDGHDLLDVKHYEEHCKKYFKRNRNKLRNLLAEDVPEGFINRQMNDTRYISKMVNGLLSNIVREANENESTAKRMIPMNGAITNKLKHDWGLNDKWNELISPRFKRLNKILNTTDFGYWDKKINAFRIQVPESAGQNFNKKRIDHRHHALDAIIIALTNRKHINYLNALNNDKVKFELKSSLFNKNERGQYSKYFKSPWKGFQKDVINILESIIISYKQDTRIINKSNNKTWQWKEGVNGLKKVLTKQTKGKNWSIRKPLHKETIAGLINMKAPKGKVVTASRVSLETITSLKHIKKVTDKSIQKILLKHLENYKAEDKYNYSLAFSKEGIEDLNKNIVLLNNGKNHHPIKKVRSFEIGKKFTLGSSYINSKKYVETAQGTNLFFAVYWDDKKQKRNFETVPLNEVIEHQKQVACLPLSEKLPVQPNEALGKFLFTLSPNDLVYVPSEDEMQNPSLVHLALLNKFQLGQVYKMVSCTEKECHFVPHQLSSQIVKNESGTNNKSERIQLFDDDNDLLDSKGKGVMIKERCWKLNVDRLGYISSVDLGSHIEDNTNVVLSEKNVKTKNDL